MQSSLIQVDLIKTAFQEEDLLQLYLVTIIEVHATFNGFKRQREGRSAGGKERDTIGQF